ncbi:MAG: hypothetical protein HZB43_02500 [candidate division Zixibacteria bacterium]|nr:hypothetical protein [candidate division Zixibacteria bacterium]
MTSHKSNTWCVLWDCVEIVCRITVQGCIAAIGVSLFLIGCSKPDTPKPLKYNIYVGCNNTDQMYVYDADSLTLIDSIPGLGNSYSMAASSDGRTLYVSVGRGPTSGDLVKVSYLSKDVVAEIRGLGVAEHMALVRGGDLILLGNLLFFSATVDADRFADFQLVEDSLYWRDGPPNGNRIAAVAPGNDHRVRVLDLETGEVHGNYIPRLQSGVTISTYRVSLHPDGRRVLVMGPSAPNAVWFVIGDVITDSTLLQQRLSAPEGRVAISDDGHYAIVTDPSSFGHIELPPLTTDVFDLTTNTHLKRFNEGDFSDWVYNAQIQFLADGKRAVLAPPPGKGGPFYVINLVTLQEEKAIWLPGDVPLTGAIGTGLRPEQ